MNIPETKTPKSMQNNAVMSWYGCTRGGDHTL